MFNDLSGKKLLGTCLKGEKPAWDSFVLQYSGLVYHSIKKTLSLYHVESCPDIVDDLFQDFFVSLVRLWKPAVDCCLYSSV